MTRTPQTAPTTRTLGVDPRASMRRLVAEDRLARWTDHAMQLAADTGVQLDGYEAYRARGRAKFARDLVSWKAPSETRKAEADHVLSAAWLAEMEPQWVGRLPVLEAEHWAYRITSLAFVCFALGAMLGLAIGRA